MPSRFLKFNKITLISLFSFGAISASNAAYIFKQRLPTAIDMPTINSSGTTGGDVPAPIGDPILEWGVATYDFGNIDVRDLTTLSDAISLINSGTASADIQVLTSSISGVFQAMSSCPSTILPGNTCITKVMANPNAGLGKISGDLYFTSSVAASKKVSLTATFYDGYQASGSLAGLSFSINGNSVNAIDFGHSVGETKSVLVTNSGSKPVVLNTGTSTGPFSISAGTTCGVSDQVLAVGSSCTLNVSYSPASAADSQNIVFSNLSGTRTLLTQGAKAYPMLEWGVNSYDFGTLDLRNTSVLSDEIILLNSGYAPATISMNTTSASGLFKAQTQCASVLQPGISCKTRIQLDSPLIPADIGEYSGELSVLNTGGVAQKVSLKATFYDGYQALGSLDGLVFEEAGVPVTSLDFGNVEAQLTKTISVHNTTGAPVLFNTALGAGAFSIDSGSTCQSTNQIISTGASCTLVIKYVSASALDSTQLTISNTSGSKGLGISGTKSYAIASVTGLSPQSALKSSSIATTLSGSGLAVISKVQYSSGTGWSDAVITSKSNTAISFNFDGTTPGTYSFRLINPDSTINNAPTYVLTVSDTLGVSSVSPSKLYLSNTTAPYAFSISGKGFNAGDTITLDTAGTNIVSGSDSLASSTARTVSFNTLPLTTSGTVALNVKSVYSTQSVVSNNITIVGVATVSNISPAVSAANTALSVTVSGTNLSGTIPQYRLAAGAWTSPTIVSQSSTQIVMTINAGSVGTYGFRLLNDDNSLNFTPSQTVSVSPTGDQVFSTPGTYSWVAPAGVTSVNVVAVGGGGAGTYGTSQGFANLGGGGGGALAWVNNIAVTPGNTYVVVVGAGGTTVSGSTPGNGGDSYFSSCGVVCAGGGFAKQPGQSNYGQGGVVKAGSGGAGGPGGASNFGQAGGAGGAGGYTGAGGAGGYGASLYSSTTTPGKDGTGGGGGGGTGTCALAGTATNKFSGGGGVGLYGVGSNGAGGVPYNSSTVTNGSGGSGGAAPTGSALFQGGSFGGGGGGTTNSNGGGYNGGGGAVRIMWGVGKSFPSNAN